MQNQVAKRTQLVSESLPIRLFYFRKYFIFSKYIKIAQHLALRLFNTSVLPHYLLNAYLLTLGQQPFFNVVNTKLLLVEVLVQLLVYEGIVPYPTFGRNPLGRHSAPPKRALNILLMGGDTHKDRHRAIFKRFPPLNKK